MLVVSNESVLERRGAVERIVKLMEMGSGEQRRRRRRRGGREEKSLWVSVRNMHRVLAP